MTIQKHVIVVLCYLITLLTISVAQAKEFRLPNTHIVPINDSQLAREYELFITLPDGYNKNAEKPYSVIYYTDAPMHPCTHAPMHPCMPAYSQAQAISY